MEDSPRAVHASGASAELDRPTQLHYLQRPLPQRPSNLASAFPDFAAAAGRSVAALVLPNSAGGMPLGTTHRFSLLRPGARQQINTLPPMLPRMRENEERQLIPFPFIRLVGQSINMLSPVLARRREDDLFFSRGPRERPLMGPHGPQPGQLPMFLPALSDLGTSTMSPIATATSVGVCETSAVDKEVSTCICGIFNCVCFIKLCRVLPCCWCVSALH